MSINWKQYQAHEVLTGKDSNNVRLISSFAKEYKQITGDDICPSCPSFTTKYNNFIKNLEVMAKKEINNSGFVLKAMYENIPAGFGSRIFVNNSNLTDELAIQLLNNHPRKEKLFSNLPKNYKELIKNTEAEALVVLEKEVTIEEALKALKVVGVQTKAKTVEGLQKIYDALEEDKKEVFHKALFTEATEE